MKKNTVLAKWRIAAIIILLAGNLMAAIPATERAALISLYNSTSGDHWTCPYGWKTPPLDTDGFAMRVPKAPGRA